MLEEALIAFPGVVLVVSHDRYFLNRVCTDILAFEGDGKIAHSVGDYDYYIEKRGRISAVGDAEPSTKVSPQKATPTKSESSKVRKLSFKEARELEGIEAQILAAESEIARIEALFATPDFHRTHATQTNQLVAQLAAVKQQVTQLYARWEELEAIKAAAG